MGANKSATIVPGHGTLFVADVNTALPGDTAADILAAFSLTGAAPADWTNIGHTSQKNQPSFSKDGGDPTVLPSWMDDAVTTVYSSTTYSLDFKDLQVDQLALDLSFGGNFDTDGGYIVPGSNNGTAKALVLYMTDGTGALLFYIPNTTVAVGDAPSIDSSTFLELDLTATILSADTDVIPAAANGISAIMKIFKTGLQQAAPVVSAATPSGAAATQVVQITGTGFTGATDVKFGATAASSFEVLSDTRIDAIMPAGSAGSAAVTVIGPGGTSNALAYTRA